MEVLLNHEINPWVDTWVLTHAYKSPAGSTAHVERNLTIAAAELLPYVLTSISSGCRRQVTKGVGVREGSCTEKILLHLKL